MDDRSLCLISHIPSSSDSRSSFVSGLLSEDGQRHIGGSSGKNIFARSSVNPTARRSAGSSDHIESNPIHPRPSHSTGGPANLMATMPENISSRQTNNHEATAGPHGIIITTIRALSLKKRISNVAIPSMFTGPSRIRLFQIFTARDRRRSDGAGSGSLSSSSASSALSDIIHGTFTISNVKRGIADVAVHTETKTRRPPSDSRGSFRMSARRNDIPIRISSTTRLRTLSILQERRD